MPQQCAASGPARREDRHPTTGTEQGRRAPARQSTRSVETDAAHDDDRSIHHHLWKRIKDPHDIGDTLGVFNHPDIAAAILKPFVSEANLWMVENHGIFQGYYFWHHIGLDRNARDQFRGHPHFEYCAQFCHLFDQPAFDGAYESMPLEAFVPILHRVMAKPKQSMYLKANGDGAW